jgi:hypothetical protein
LASGHEHGSPDEVGFQGLEDRLDHGVEAPIFVKRWPELFWGGKVG